MEKEKSKEKLTAWFGKVKEVSGNPQLTLSADEFKVVQPNNSMSGTLQSINLDYGMKEKNPIDALRFYRKDNPDKAVQLSKDEVSYLLPEKFAETKVMVFYKGKDNDLENLIKHHIKEFCVAHLAGEMVKSLRAHQDLDITEKEELCVQIAGLCHDLGHGPFSHAFEIFMKEVKPDLQWKHEKQSVKIFQEIIKPHIVTHSELGEEDFTMIEQLICPPSDIPKDKLYMYQIVANPTTGIDVDKMDYFSRDCHHLGMKCNFSHERYMKFARVCTDENGEKQICMRDKEAMNMYELFHVRNLLHHNAYQHRVTKAVELMIVDALKAADETLKISDKVENLQQYLALTDEILQEIQRSAESLQKAKDIITQISKRELYRFIGAKIFNAEELKPLDEIKVEVLKAWLGKVKGGLTLKEKEEFDIVHISFSYGMKEKNPIDALRFYRKDDPNTPVQLSKDEVSYLLPEKFFETKVMVFYKGKDKAVENLIKHHIKEFWPYLDPVSAVVHNPSLYADLTDIKPDLFQQIRDSAQKITEKFSVQGTYKVIAEKVFRAKQLKHLGSNEQWKLKLKAWLDNEKKTGDKQLTVTADDFKVDQYPLPGKPDSTKVILLYNGFPEEDTEKFWEAVLKHLILCFVSISYFSILFFCFIDGKTPIIICLLLSAGRHVIERLLNQGFFIIDQKIFKAENLKHLSSLQWE
ncbi:hypothetical protein NFI96_027361, partial [Prochilodus magdalenae]